MVFNIAVALLQMSSGGIFTHEGKLVCCAADSSWWVQMNYPGSESALSKRKNNNNKIKINTYHPNLEKKPSFLFYYFYLLVILNVCGHQ